jgi:undecaprenyl phosphate N,N'-diacetylbacillosamine 1-phosphate transferase
MIKGIYQRLFKRVIDFCIALVALIVFSPFLLLIAVSLYFTNSGKVLFIQARPGVNERIFKLIKFKTMNDKKDPHGNLLPDKERMTQTGRFLRATSVDELPQFINVLIGDMSLIGPRPLLVRYLPLYSDVQKRRHNVRPGITGWAQVNGRNAITWNERFELDIWYVDNLSLLLDIKIVVRTIVKVFNREGVNATEGSTMLPFTGNKQEVNN